jgi:hypothetical protein
VTLQLLKSLKNLALSFYMIFDWYTLVIYYSLGMLADQKLKRFQEDFPQLSAGTDGNAGTVKREDKSLQFAYGPGPSLRPQSQCQRDC